MSQHGKGFPMSVKVLVVDNNLTFRISLLKFLENKGLQVYTANSFDEVLKIHNQIMQVSFAIINLQMPHDEISKILLKLKEYSISLIGLNPTDNMNDYLVLFQHVISRPYTLEQILQCMDEHSTESIHLQTEDNNVKNINLNTFTKYVVGIKDIIFKLFTENGFWRLTIKRPSLPKLKFNFSVKKRYCLPDS
jgi:CheY-like chemotaxis protein